MRAHNAISDVFISDIHNFKFYSVLIFVCGVVFAMSYRQNCQDFLSLLIIIFGILLILYSLDISSYRAYFYGAELVFLLGVFYVLFYHKSFLQNTYYHQKLYLQGNGRIIEKNPFTNNANHTQGFNLKILVHQISKLELDNKYSNKITNKKTSNKKSLKPRKPNKNTVKTKSTKSKQSLKRQESKRIKKKLILDKKIYKNFINTSDYQELDRRLFDIKNNIYFNDWIEVKQKKFLKFAPQILSLSYINNSANKIFDVNDEIAFKALIDPIEEPDFVQSFNQEFDALGKNIDGFGYIISKPELIHKASYDSFNNWFLNWRELIRDKINNNLKKDSAGIALALLIGEQNYISKNLLSAIRISGLSHLLSISGFHLSLACAIFFVSIRFILSRSEFIALRVDIKKISAVFAIVASFLYVKITNSSIPSQRALIMVWMLMLSLLIDRKFDGLRALFLALFLLTIINPYSLYQLGFRLSFIGVLICICYYSDWRLKIFPSLSLTIENRFITGTLSKIRQYFLDIFIVTFFIQIACLPIFMNSFQTFSFIAFIANLIAIPLVSFLIMPCAFSVLIFMNFGCEKLPFLLLNQLIEVFVKCVNMFIKFPLSSFSTAYLTNFFTLINILSVVIFFITKNLIIRISIFTVFVLTIFLGMKKNHDQIILEKTQKFYAIFHENKLFFSKKMNKTKQVQNWLKIYDDKESRVIKSCNYALKNNLQNCQQCQENYCEIFFKNQKILVLTSRNKIDEICQKIQQYRFDVVVNLTKKYQLPECINKSFKHVKVIDNQDFLAQKTIFID